MNIKLQKQDADLFRMATVSLDSPIATFSSWDWHPAHPTHGNWECTGSTPLRTNTDQRMSIWSNSKWHAPTTPVCLTVDLRWTRGYGTMMLSGLAQSLTSEGTGPWNTQLKAAVYFSSMNFSSSDPSTHRQLHTAMRLPSYWSNCKNFWLF